MRIPHCVIADAEDSVSGTALRRRERHRDRAAQACAESAATGAALGELVGVGSGEADPIDGHRNRSGVRQHEAVGSCLPAEHRSEVVGGRRQSSAWLHAQAGQRHRLRTAGIGVIDDQGCRARARRCRTERYVDAAVLAGPQCRPARRSAREVGRVEAAERDAVDGHGGRAHVRDRHRLAGRG